MGSITNSFERTWIFQKKKFSFLTLFKNGKFLEKKPISPEFCFKIVVADGYFEMAMNGNIS